MRNINEVVLHHTACNNTFEKIQDWHIKGRGWSDVFYHYVIDMKGLIHEGRNINKFATSNRKDAIEIAVVGRLHLENILPSQHIALKNLLYKITNDFGILPVFGHKDFTATICPGELNVDFYHNFVCDLGITWKDKIMERAKTLGLITQKHNPDDFSPKWFVLETIMRAMRKTQRGQGEDFKEVK